MIAPMNMQISSASATALNDMIWINGGFNCQERMISAEVHQWALTAQMQFGRVGVSCITYHS